MALHPNDTDQMDMRTLWNTDTDRARAELNWLITLVFTVFLMALMVVPLIVVNPRQWLVLSILPEAVALDPNDTDQMDMRTLWNTDTDRARAVLNWRITLVVTVFMMALMVVPLSVVNPRQGRVLSMLPAMLLYLVFFLIQTSLKSNGGKGKLDPTLWMWTVNLIYLALAIVLNLWDTVPVRRLRASFSRKGAVCDTDRARAVLNWRITLVVTVFMMALMVVPLSVVNPRQGRVLSMLPAMLLYLVFFLIQTSLKSNGGKGKLDPTLWMWTVNLIYLALAIVLNLWDTVPVRRLRASFSRKGAV